MISNESRSNSEPRPINVLHLLDSSEIAGGQRYVSDLIKHSDAKFKHTVLLSKEGPFSFLLKETGIHYEFISMEKKLSLASVMKISRCIRNNNIEIVHSHGYRCNLYGRLSCLFTGAKNIATVHVSLYDYIDTPFLLRGIYLLIESMTSVMTHRYICISTAMKTDLRKIGISEDKIVIIHNGVDLDVFHPRSPDKGLAQELCIVDHHPVIGTVGRMVTEKGHVYLLEALPYLREQWPTLQCLFIGTGPLMEMLRKRASELDVAEKCFFPGVRMDMADIYPLMDIFVLPSLREPFGLVLLEAMASGVPVIATASGGPLDFIHSGINGLLVPPADPKELADKMDFLLSHPERREEIARQGYETVRKNYGIKDTVRQICDVYRLTAAQ